jgi:hypothetical protein
MPRSVLDERETRWAVDCRETHVRDLVVYLGYNRIPDGLFVLRPERKRPLRACDSPRSTRRPCRPATSKTGCRGARHRSTG